TPMLIPTLTLSATATAGRTEMQALIATTRATTRTRVFMLPPSSVCGGTARSNQERPERLNAGLVPGRMRIGTPEIQAVAWTSEGSGAERCLTGVPFLHDSGSTWPAGSGEPRVHRGREHHVVLRLSPHRVDLAAFERGRRAGLQRGFGEGAAASRWRVSSLPRRARSTRR